MKKYKELTREEEYKLYQEPPFSYSGHMLEVAMKSADRGREFRKSHFYTLPNNMRQTSFNGNSDTTIDDVMDLECECGEKCN